MSWTESHWCSNAQAAAKVTGGMNCFFGYVDFGADFGGIVSERSPGLCESSTASGSRKELNVKFRFKPGEPTTDDRLGYAKPEGSRRNPSSVSNFHKCL